MNKQTRHQRHRKLREFYLRRACGGTAALAYSPKLVLATTNLSRHQVRYWMQKVVDPSFHPGKWGGYRYSKFTTDERKKIEAFVWALLKADCSLHAKEICHRINAELGLEVKSDWVYDLLRSWRW